MPSLSAPPFSPLGSSIPYGLPHGVSVSLPAWVDNVDYEEGHERIAKAMSSGYPRFYIHHQIDQLAQSIAAKVGLLNEVCLLLPTEKTATSCQHFLNSRATPVPSRQVKFPIRSSDAPSPAEAAPQPERVIDIYAVFVAPEHFGMARQFWQHTGDGISSRTAERCLIMLGAIAPETNSIAQTSKGKNRHYAAKSGAVSNGSAVLVPAASSAPMTSSKSRYATNRSQTAVSIPAPVPQSILAPEPAADDDNDEYLTQYVEERYGRNLDLSLAPVAKLAMRRRLAGVLRESSNPSSPSESTLEACCDIAAEDNSRGVVGLTEDDVWLYSCGMSAIFHAHQLALKTRERQGGAPAKSVCFGFPYTDTLKILEKWGPGVHFFGNGMVSDLPALRTLLSTASPPILALFCEFPSNPLLRTPPLRELRKLADEFGFMIVIDETIAGFVNVEVLPLADIVVSSLTKVFSGDSNVMGGSLVINPASPHYASLKATQEAEYEDAYFDEDAIYMERNSRDFQDRIARENANAVELCEMLRSRRAPGPCALGMIPVPDVAAPNPARPRVLKEVYYPKYMTPDNYLDCMRPACPATPSSPGFGGLFSVTFTSILASSTFYDALPCYKGPSLGTNFTLACPYTILAHYTETEWALTWGVEKGLVRVSTGLEDPDMLKQWFSFALDAAELAVEQALAEQAV